MPRGLVNGKLQTSSNSWGNQSGEALLPLWALTEPTMPLSKRRWVANDLNFKKNSAPRCNKRNNSSCWNEKTSTVEWPGSRWRYFTDAPSTDAPSSAAPGQWPLNSSTVFLNQFPTLSMSSQVMNQNDLRLYTVIDSEWEELMGGAIKWVIPLRLRVEKASTFKVP